MWYVIVWDDDLGWARERYGPYPTRDHAFEIKRSLIKSLRDFSPSPNVKNQKSQAEQVTIHVRQVHDE